MIGFILAVLLGFGPMFFLAWCIYWLDRYEKEPKFLLGVVFAWGAVIAVIGALGLQLFLGESLMFLTGSKVIGEVAGASLFAPVTEEILKGLAVLLVFLFFHNEFDSILDGIVYASVAALGFAATEDVLYYYSAYAKGGMAAMGGLVFLRLVIFGWQHAFFTSFIGIGLAVARMQRDRAARLAAPLAGLAMAIFVHSLHNTLLTFLSGVVGLAVATFVAWSGWLLMFFFILYLIRREKSWLAEYLREEVALQTITPGQYHSVCSFFGQTRARMAVLGSPRYHDTSRFYQLCGELSHKKRQLATMGDEDGNRQQVELLRAELSRISPNTLG